MLTKFPLLTDGKARDMAREINLNAIQIVARCQFAQDLDLVLPQSLRCEIPHAVRPPRSRDDPVGMLHLERVRLLRWPTFWQAFNFADTMTPECLKLAPACFVHQLLDPIHAVAEPLFQQRMIHRRLDLAWIGTSQ